MNEQTDQEPTRVVLEEAEYSPPSDDYLREQILAFLRENRPSTYAELKASGELEHAVAWRLEEVKRFAENLIATGTHPPQAWNWAIRVKSEDTRRGDGLDGQRPPPFCGPHGDSTPEPSWNRARALVSETHRRPSRRPFATHLYP